MKQGRSLDDLAAEIQRQSLAARDFIAPTKALSVETAGGVTNLLMPTSGKNLEEFTISEPAHAQIASKTGLPLKTYRRLQQDYPNQYDDLVDAILDRESRDVMARTLDGRLRALVSNRFRAIDHYAVTEAALTAIHDEHPDMHVASAQITDTNLYLKFVFPSVTAEVKRGDVVRSGLIVKNSETGHGSLDVAPFLERLACLNGLVTQSFFRKSHLGQTMQVDDDGVAAEWFRDETREADDKVLLMKLGDVVRGTVTEDGFLKTIKLLQDSTEDVIEGDPAAAVVEVAKQHNLSDGERGGVLRHLIEGGDLSRYGVIQAVTRTAEDVPSYDRATELETMGGRILATARSDWNSIATAA